MNTKPIYVTKSFMPPIDEYTLKIQDIFNCGVLTNQGPCVQKLESKMREFLNTQNFHYLSNGTIALQIALHALGIDDGEIITTPFSYVATASSILWQRCKPVFVDIESNNFTIDASKIEAAITPNTRAIMPVHVFGYACDVDKIQQIASKHNLKIIYDGAHAFASEYNGKSLLTYGDITTCSFHATKLFHTVEGGACIVQNKDVSDKLDLIKRFGHQFDNHMCLGINGKQSEIHAAMGLANFPYIEHCISERKRVSDIYDNELANLVIRPQHQPGLKYNYAYYPVVFESESQLLHVFDALKSQNIFARRYFWPSLNKIQYINGASCPVSEDISSRIACLPLYPDLSDTDVLKIVNIIKGSL
ncbi:MAG: DegT/DnrJ/EryC1/StrS family aminotransferase [Muribaculaceae bacterium]|nr:DegT/DnrJ/EryC1/StrS family aminotransferase [Muribaculaceae bacterium]